MNAVLVLIVSGVGALIICLRLSPRSLRELSAWCRATADAHDERKSTYRRALISYRREMGLNDDIPDRTPHWAKWLFGENR